MGTPGPQINVIATVGRRRRAKEKGKSWCTHAPHMIHKHADGTEEWMAFFKDPEGRTLAIMSQTQRPS